MDSRVKAFQRHRKITIDGIVGPQTWRYLVFYCEQPDLDKPGLCLGKRYGRDTNNYPWDSWDTSSTVSLLEGATATFTRRYDNQAHRYRRPRVAFRDLSLEHRGDIDGHDSHELVMDIDIRPMSTTNEQCTGGLTFCSGGYSKYRTVRLVEDLKASSRLGRNLHQFRIFNDSKVVRKVSGVIQDRVVNGKRGTFHDDQSHVRSCTAYYPYDNRYDC